MGVVFVFGITELPFIVGEGVANGDGIQVTIAVILHVLPSHFLPGIFGALLFGFLVGGGLACVQHLCLRLILWHHYIAPWNLARFLNYCVERRLLQRVGGRYRFVHRELLDYFAEMTTS